MSGSQTGGHDDAPAVSISQVSKTYPGVVALQPTDLDVRTGTVHALVGENGAGKSTLLKILAGAQPATTGVLRFAGDAVSLSGPRQARRLGVMAVYQELTVLPNLSALENVFIGDYITRRGLPDRDAMTRQFDLLCQRMGATIRPQARGDTLSIADQQVLEIMRALHARARVLLLDEPTASLALHERQALGRTMRTLADDGVTVIWISHNLDEVLELSDDVSVFREGWYVETRPASLWNKRALVRAMLGDRAEVVALNRVEPKTSAAITVRELDVPGILQHVNFDLRQGEIVGVAGLMGSGRSELLRALAGLDATASGRLTIDGRTSDLPTSPREAARRQLALAPEDRKTQGLVLGMSTEENISMPAWKTLRRWGTLTTSRKSRYAAVIAPAVGLPTHYLRRPVGSLSGGNQQKAVLGKWASRSLRLFLVDEPTRGIDINAKAEVYQLLNQMTVEGTAILLVSSEFDELVEVCDRVLVVAGGSITAELEREQLSEERILHCIFEVAS